MISGTHPLDGEQPDPPSRTLAEDILLALGLILVVIIAATAVVCMEAGAGTIIYR